MNRTVLIAAVAAWAMCLASPAGAADPAPKAPVSPVVRILVTFQTYEPAAPWSKRSNEERAGYGCVLPSGKILTTADLIKNHTFIKVTKSTSGEYHSASVEAVDYDANLVLLAIDTPRYFSDMVPFELGEDVPLDTPVHFLVFEDSGDVRAIPGVLVRAAVSEYALGFLEYLLYGATVSFEGQKAGWGEPVVSQGKLIGLTTFYSEGTQSAKIIPSSIIRHFLRDAGSGSYRGFPYHGFWITTVRDPVFKRYLGMPDGIEGLYVRYVAPGGSADGTLKVGDLVSSLDGHTLDWDGNYRHPLWGRLAYQDLISRLHYPGDVVPVDIIRGGRPMSLRMKLKRMEPEQYLVPVNPPDPRPAYLVVGGLVIQELTTGYLRAWGEDWTDKAEKRLLFYERYEWLNRLPGRRRIVVLNRVLPDEINIGYQGMKDLVVTRVNGRTISDLCDVAEALRAPENGLHRITLKQFGVEIAIDVNDCAAAAERIAARYGVGEMRYLPECGKESGHAPVPPHKEDH